MKLKEVIVDADFCIKVGVSSKYRYLEKVLPSLANKVYIHKIAYDEVMIPACAKEQLDSLKNLGILIIVDERTLSSSDVLVYQSIYNSLASVMINPNQPRKNLGEVCSLAMAKTKSIPYFVTDEKNLQPIIDKLLNNGIEDIICIRIEDVIRKIMYKVLEGFSRKDAKAIWRMSGKDTDIFDNNIWPSGTQDNTVKPF